MRNFISFISFSDNAIHQNSWWSIWLICNEFLYALILFFSYKILKNTHIIYFLWGFSLTCGILFSFVHRPLSSEKKLKRSILPKVFKYSALKTVYFIFFFYGLTNVGPFRTILLSEHSDVVYYAFLLAIFKGMGGPGKLRGSLWMVLGLLSLLLFDNDTAYTLEHPEGNYHHGIKHVVYFLFSWTGLSDHEGGILILVLSAFQNFILNHQHQRLSLEIKGGKRFIALTWSFIAFLTTPLALSYRIFMGSSISYAALLSTSISIVAVAMMFVIHFYIYGICAQHLSRVSSARYRSLAIFVFGFLLSLVSSSSTLEISQHGLSGGVIFTLILFSIGTHQLTSSSGRKRYGLLADIEEEESNDLSYLHDFSSEALQRSQSIFNFFSTGLQSILANKNSRTIFYFLCLNLGFTFVELVYGMLTNSLGLISDGFHMLFDCSALVMGLCASVIAEWKPTKYFPYGYGRIEVLSGFVNGLFLCIVALMILLEAAERLFEPPPVKTERLLFVAVCGFLVNICGIFAFSFNSHGHNHSHGSHSHGHTHSHGHSHNANMQGVFLHILADTLGSVGVIVSTILIQYYGYLIADPICSLILSCLILASVFPLLKESIAILVLRIPPAIDEASKEALNKILKIDGVLGYEDVHLWQHSANVTVADMKIYIRCNSTELNITRQATQILQSAGYNEITLQISIVKEQKDLKEKAAGISSIGTVLSEMPHVSLVSSLSTREI